jgi:putative redox protein
MKASARHSNGPFTHRIEVRGHQLTVDEPADHGGADEGPSPQELLAASVASCTAVTMRMYANRKGWDIGQLEVECQYEMPERGVATHFDLVLRIPDSCTQEQVDALTRIAGKCPVHRALEGPSTFDERIELVRARPIVAAP